MFSRNCFGARSVALLLVIACHDATAPKPADPGCTLTANPFGIRICAHYAICPDDADAYAKEHGEVLLRGGHC